YERDLKQATEVIKKDSVDLVLCNSPYFKERPTSQKNPNPHLAIAPHEIHTSLQEVVTVSGDLLKTNGRLPMVDRPGP
ncbi:SAM-dependent methyltransferase, partial [Enterococcus faecalis]